MKLNQLFILILIFVMFSFVKPVNAASYTPTDNLFDSSQADNLVQMANSQIPNFTSLNYAIFQVDDNYYLVAGKDVSVNSNSVVFTNSTVISAIRNDSSYYGRYTYNTSNETSTTVFLGYVIQSNVDTDKSVTSALFNDFQFKMNMVNIGIFILGLCFAIFVTKERRY